MTHGPWSSLVERGRVVILSFTQPNSSGLHSRSDGLLYSYKTLPRAFRSIIRFVIPVPVGSELRDPLGLFDGRRGHLPASLCGCALAELK